MKKLAILIVGAVLTYASSVVAAEPPKVIVNYDSASAKMPPLTLSGVSGNTCGWNYGSQIRI